MPTGIVTVSSYTPEPPIQVDVASTFEVRGWYTRSFIAGDGVTAIEGNATSGEEGFYYNVPSTVNADNELVVPAHDIQATTLSNPTANYFEGLWIDGAFVQMLMPNTNVATGWQIPTIYGAVIAIDEIALYNRAKRLLYPPDTYFTADQVIQEIQRLAGNFDYMAVGVNGIGSASFPPVVASNPIVLMENDPRVGSYFNILSYSAATTNTAAQNTVFITAAVTAAALVGGGIYIPVGTFPINSITISVPVLCAPGASILEPATLETVTITKAFEADTSKHFGNAAFGQGTISFVGNVSLKEIYTEWWGAVADGVTSNNHLAINAAFAQTGQNVRLLKGNYNITANLTEPVCNGIIGAGSAQTLITAATGVTKVLSLGNECVYHKGYQIVGNATNNAMGIKFGDAQSGAYIVEDVWVTAFTGAGAVGGVGVQIFQTLKTIFISCLFYANRTNLLIDGEGTLFPTTTTFLKCGCINALGVGTAFVDCETISMIDCYWDSNALEAITMLRVGSNAIETVVLERPRFENNYASDSTKFNVRVGDNSVGAGIIKFAMRDPQFGTTAGNAKAIRCNGAEVQGFVISNPFGITGQAGSILVENGAFGEIPEWESTSGMAYSTRVSDALNQVAPGPWAEWSTWTPANAKDSTGGTVFAVGPTYTVTKFKRMGQTVLVEMNVSLTCAAVNPTYVQFEVPTSLMPATNTVALITQIGIGAGPTFQPGAITTLTADNGWIRVSKADNSAFGVSAILTFSVVFEYRLLP